MIRTRNLILMHFLLCLLLSCLLCSFCPAFFVLCILFPPHAANHANSQQVQPGSGPADSGVRQRHREGLQGLQRGRPHLHIVFSAHVTVCLLSPVYYPAATCLSRLSPVCLWPVCYSSLTCLTHLLPVSHLSAAFLHHCSDSVWRKRQNLCLRVSVFLFRLLTDVFSSS